MNSFATQYPKLSSAIHTFLATFIVTLVGAVSVIPADTILSPQTWSMAAISGIVIAAVRAAIKAVSPIA